MAIRRFSGNTASRCPTTTTRSSSCLNCCLSLTTNDRAFVDERKTDDRLRALFWPLLFFELAARFSWRDEQLQTRSSLGCTIENGRRTRDATLFVVKNRRFSASVDAQCAQRRHPKQLSQPSAVARRLVSDSNERRCKRQKALKTKTRAQTIGDRRVRIYFYSVAPSGDDDSDDERSPRCGRRLFAPADARRVCGTRHRRLAGCENLSLF